MSRIQRTWVVASRAADIGLIITGAFLLGRMLASDVPTSLALVAFGVLFTLFGRVLDRTRPSRNPTLVVHTGDHGHVNADVVRRLRDMDRERKASL